MISSLRCLFLSILIVSGAFAQSDSLTISDTIGVHRQRGLLQSTYQYSYYGATQLADIQLNPLLKHAPDSLTRHLFRQGRRLDAVSTGLAVVSFGLIAGSLSTPGRQSRVNGGLFLAGYAVLFGRFIPASMSDRRIAEAVQTRNTVLRTQLDAYVPPVVYTASQQWPLSLADTISGRRVRLSYQYTYRGIRIYPSQQTSRLTMSLNDYEVNQGLRYVRTMSSISGLVGGVGRSLLVSYLTGLLLNRNRRYRSSGSTVSDEFLTIGLVGMGTSFALNRYINQAQRHWVMRYNERIRQQFRPE